MTLETKKMLMAKKGGGGNVLLLHMMIDAVSVKSVFHLTDLKHIFRYNYFYALQALWERSTSICKFYTF